MSTEYLKAIPVLPVQELERSIAFYSEKLGFSLSYRAPDEYAILRAEGVELHLWVAADESWQQRREDGSPVRSGAESFLAGTAGCRIEVAGVAELYQRVLPLGVVHANGALRDTEYRTREFAVTDPDNNLLTLFEKVPG